MSINAISSVSLYEYYYQINREDERKKKSPIAVEMEEYGLKPTDDEALNVAMLKRAKELSALKESQSQTSEVAPSERPWVDLMYQLNLPFNDDPKDDIQDIKDELALLIRGIDDEELSKEVKDLEKYVENLYLNFEQSSIGALDSSIVLNSQLNNLSMLNRANLF